MKEREFQELEYLIDERDEELLRKQEERVFMYAQSSVKKNKKKAKKK